MSQTVETAGRPVLILSAEGEDDLAEKLAEPIRRAGYTVAYRGTVLVGDSIHADVSRHLTAGAPVVVCATERVLARGLVHRLVNALRSDPNVRLFPVRMEKEVYLETITWGSQVAEYWQDPAKALDDLVKALTQYYPPHPDTPTSLPAPESSAARQRYLQHLAAKTHYVLLRGLDPKAADAQQSDAGPSLTDVYIDLETLARPRSPEDRKGKRTEPQLTDDQPRTVSVLTAFGEARRMVLLGDPGSGKSTFVNHLAHCLAQGQASDTSDAYVWPEDLPEAWRDWLPVRIVLREMAAWLRGHEVESVKVGLLRAYLQGWLDENGHTDFAAAMWQQIQAGKAILLLDGWDEVSNEGKAIAKLQTMLNELPAAFPNCPMLTTCRVRSYSEQPWRLDARRWPEFALLAFDDDKIDYFVDVWYRQLGAVGRVPNWEASATKLKTAVRRPDLRRMAGNPLLLTIMALDHADKGELPDARSVVYEDVVDLLLWKWRQTKSEEDASLSLKDLLHEAGRQDIDFKRLLWQVAYEAHTGGMDGDDGERTANVSELTLRKHFAHLSDPPSWDRAEEFLRLMQFRTGLLIPSGTDSYTFPHRTFQEYLAACHVCSQGDVVKTALALACCGAYWREVVLLAVNRLVYYYGDTSRPLDLVRRLCPSSSPGGDAESYWRQIALAGECVLEIGLGRAADVEDAALIDHVRSRLTSVVGSGRLDMPERIRAGSTLSLLGDPRNFGEMVLVPAGPFVMGTDANADAPRHEIELDRLYAAYGSNLSIDAPRHEIELDAFSIGKYPVTEREYAEFVLKAKYHAPAHWRENAPPADRRNHPVVNVSWEDAVAYCKWLSKRQGVVYSLPTEAQWEKAARGTDERVYPWGNEWNASFCANSVGDNRLQGTVTVGSYPTDVSPYGCLDMAGNVLEWCYDWYDEDYYKTSPNRNPQGSEKVYARVLRGGFWISDDQNIFRAANRIYIIPHYRYVYVGFRVALQG